MMWDSLKMVPGSANQDKKWLVTDISWGRGNGLSIGVVLADLETPEGFLSVTNAVLTPETECEVVKKGECWVPNVVFTCGAVPEQDKEVLDDDDKILVYYGAADTNICVATGSVGEIIPKEVRERLQVRIK